MHFRDDYQLFPSFPFDCATTVGDDCCLVVGPFVFAVNNLLLGLSSLYRPWVSSSVDLFVRECEALVVMLGEECVGARVELTLV